jgi:tRNA(His) guanylyltransferase
VVKDALGDRMKAQYERRTRYMLPRRTWTVIRVDGKAFHTYTRGLEKPFDTQLVYDMSRTAAFLAAQVEGTKLAYVQSDEISLVLTDFANPQTQAWFDGNVQKMCSISASIATAEFNSRRPDQMAFFDSRVFTIPDRTEVENYLVWRQADAVRNSIQMLAQAHFSHKKMHGLNQNELQDKLMVEKRVNWNDLPDHLKRGSVVYRGSELKPVTYTDKRTGEVVTTDPVERFSWIVEGAPRFSQNREWLSEVLPETPSTGTGRVSI